MIAFFHAFDHFLTCLLLVGALYSIICAALLMVANDLPIQLKMKLSLLYLVSATFGCFMALNGLLW